MCCFVRPATKFAIYYSMTQDQEKQIILKFENLGPSNIKLFFEKWIKQLIKIVA